MNHRMAILVDGAFYLKRAKSLKGLKTPQERANELTRYCLAHAKHENAEIYRIFYYDCDPLSKKSVKTFLLRFFPTDYDLYEYLQAQPKKAEYLRNLIREDMDRKND